MGRPRIELKLENATAEDIKVAMECTPTKKGFLRLQSIYYLHRGQSWEFAAQLGLVSERQLLRWVKLFNARGIDGLVPKPRPGCKRIISKELFVEKVLPVVRAPAQAQQVHWTGVKLHGWLKAEFQKEVSYSTLVRYLHEHNFCLKVPRPWPEGQDEAKRQQFVQELQTWLADPDIELWFADETGIEGDPRPRRRWAHKSDKIKVPYHGKHLRQNVLGAVCPATGQISAVIFDYCDGEVFQAFLDNLAAAIPFDPKKKRYLIVDNASWHKTKSLCWHHFEPKYLPPYSPDLNPIERLWLRLKADFFADFIASEPEPLIERITAGLLHFFNHPNNTIPLCKIKSSL